MERVSRVYSSSLLGAIIARNHLPFFKIFSNFIYFSTNFQVFCPFSEKSHACSYFLEQALVSLCNQSEYGEIRTRKTLNTYNFHAAVTNYQTRNFSRMQIIFIKYCHWAVGVLIDNMAIVFSSVVSIISISTNLTCFDFSICKSVLCL